MSFILSSLQKNDNQADNKQDTVPSLAADDLQKELQQPGQATAVDSEGVNWQKPMFVMVIIVLSGALGYFFMGGMQAYQLTQQRQLLEQQLSQTTAAEPEELISLNVNQPMHAHFIDGAAFNQQMREQRLANVEQKRAEQALLAKQQSDRIAAEKQAQNQQLQQQIKSLLALQDKQNQQAQVTNSNRAEPAPVVEEPKFSLNTDELQGVDPKLLAAVENALNETMTAQSGAEPVAEQKPVERVKPLGQMPSWLHNELPELVFSLHMYTSDSATSWVRLNDKDYYTGNVTQEGITIERIEPQLVIMQYKGMRFSMQALSSW
ncbi:general secretion pathway protein GspB [Thalassotalea sp. Y01]|uniref:general secretion pathway protein GspB n=1 Tax=Thalassotalea sp. Y01 TaxID=2729613 RepID=UPI00145CEAE4|nr:general secretion pathway protein GspB [Thalassotalea sp. Y01]NMP15148.1 general secretion pathway protein GspB [Thalassotalea sp. Y01]